MTSVQDSYARTPLDSGRNEIRILELRVPTSEQPELYGALRRISLDDVNEPFVALSYLWGPSTRAERISLGGSCSLDISDNLSSALRAVIARGTPQRIWADAICINQRNIQERGEQVQMMRKIYTQASMVVSWIDCEIVLENNPWPLLLSLSDATADDAVIFNVKGSLSHQPNEQDNRGFMDWVPLLSIMQNSYWSRVWIQQEIAFARKWELICGNDSLSDSLGHFTRIWTRRFGDESIQNSPWFLFRPPPALLLKHSPKLSSAPTAWQRSDNPLGQSLLSVLERARSLKCTDDRDRLYAMMLLADNVRDGDITADYSVSLNRTFLKVATYLIDRHTCLDFLSYAGIGESDPKSPINFPTWVPDWTGDSLLQSGPSARLGRCRHPSTFPEHLVPYIEDGDQTLHAYGIKLTTISKPWELGTASSTATDNLMFSTVHGFQRHCFDMVKHAMARIARRRFDLNNDAGLWDAANFMHGQTNLMLTVFCAVQCFTEYSGEIEKNLRGPDSARALMVQIANSVKDFFTRPHFVGRDLDKAFRTGDLLELSETQDPMLSGLYPCSEAVCAKNGFAGCRFLHEMFESRGKYNFLPFIGEKGEMGMAPFRAQEGDELWALVGCSGVTVLRQGQERRLLLVGEGYMDSPGALIEPSDRLNFGGVQKDIPSGAKVGDSVHGLVIEEVVLM